MEKKKQVLVKDSQKNTIVQRSWEVREVLGEAPSSIIRYGIFIIFVMIVLLVIGSIVIKYPDVIHGSCYITSKNPPIRIKPKKAGKIAHLLIEDNEEVERGQCLAVIEDAASYQSVVFLNDLLHSPVDSLLAKFPLKKNLTLGSLQMGYSLLEEMIAGYNYFSQNQFFDDKIRMVEEKVNSYKLYIHQLNKKKNLQEMQLGIKRKSFLRDSLLFERGVISTADWEKSSLQILEGRQVFQDLRTNLSSAKFELVARQQELLELRVQKLNTIRDKEFAIHRAIVDLKGQIDLWKEQNLLTSPIQGNISLVDFWEENQNVVENQVVMIVYPKQRVKIFGKAELQAFGAGRLRRNQVVNIKLDNYPYREFGMLKGKLVKLSLTEERTYIATISLPDTLVTNYGVTIPLSQEMTGAAEIITEKMNLFERLFMPLKSLIRN
jgi:HlyD family secretion protein